MGARYELNNIHTIGSLAVAGFLGLLTGSWLVFALTGAVLIGAAIHCSNIRPNGGDYRSPRR